MAGYLLLLLLLSSDYSRSALSPEPLTLSYGNCLACAPANKAASRLLMVVVMVVGSGGGE